MAMDFRSDPSESVEGKGVARRAWDAYANGLRRATEPVFDPVAGALSRKLHEDLMGFWFMWHACGGFEGLQRYGMHKTTIWRKVRKFRMLLGQHPDEYKLEGVTIDTTKLWDGLAGYVPPMPSSRKPK